MLRAGRRSATGSTTWTPNCSRSNHAVARVAPRTAIRGHGTRGHLLDPMNSTATTDSPIAAEARFALPSWPTADQIWVSGVPPETVIPRSLPSWPATMITATPAR